MASAIDPITGLPLDFTVPDQYQIPLDSQPALAPEWNPQGRIDQTLFPDNIPAIFATLQAQNIKSPANVQACTTDGFQRLRVTFDGGATPAVTHSFADTAEPAEATLYTFDLGIVPASLLGFTGSTMWINYNGPDSPEHVAFWLQGNTSGAVLELGRIAINYNGSPQSGIPFTIVRDWPVGLNLDGYFPGDTSVSLAAITNSVFGTISWTLLTG